MADPQEHVDTPTSNPAASDRHQSYFLEVPGTANAKALSVVSFEAIERMGEPYRITLALTHPETLDKDDYLGKDASFCIAPLDGSAPRKFCGCITRFSNTKTTRDFSAYQIVVEAHIARLALTRASRLYQHQSAPQIIEAILRRHGFKGHQFSFKLRRAYPQHALRFQYQIADWPYIHILMQQEGLYSYLAPGKHGDILVFADDIDHYVYEPELKVPYRETAGLEAGLEAVYALQTHAQTVPASFLVADYNPEQAYERFKAEANAARKDPTTWGQPYVYGTHHLDQGSAQWAAQLRHEAALAGQIVYEGQSNVLDLRPGRILRLDQALPEAPTGQVITEVTHTGARDAAYRNHYRAIPAARRFRLPIEDATWPKIAGTLSARVTSPGRYKYAYLTQQGHYTVRFDCDFDEWNPGGESVPLRLAKPFAGAAQTGFHFPALDGTEAVLEFRDGDPNKPYISQFHHNSQHSELITNQERWLSRNVIRTQSNNKIRMEDWEGQESIKVSTDYAGKSQLNLGYLVDGKKQQRGDGFELRSSGWGAIRAGKGLLISAHDQPGAGGAQLEMEVALTQLQAALAETRALRSAAQQATAELAEIKAQQTQLESAFKELQKAVILLSAPEGIGAVTPKSIHLASGEHLSVTAGKNADFSVGGSFTAAAAHAVSLFAQQNGIKALAANGKVEVQAQNDAMNLAAHNDVSIASADGCVTITAKKEILFVVGGSYLRISNVRIEDGTSGDRIIRSAAFQKSGPQSLSVTIPPLPGSISTYDQAFVVRWAGTQIPAANVKYQMFSEGSLISEAVTSEYGETALGQSHVPQDVLIKLLDN